MAIIKTLDILLRGRTGDLKKDLAGASADLAKFSRFAGGALAAVGVGGGILGIAGSIAKLKSVMESMGDLANRSKQFGIDPRELKSLETVAELAGVGVEELAKANQKLMIGISTARDGVGGYSDVLKKLGLSVSAMGKLSATDRLVSIAQAMQGVTDSADKTTMAISLFGKAGRTLIPLLSDGGKKIREISAIVKRFGLGFEAWELQRVEDANDAIFILGETVKGIIGRIGVQLSPTIQALADNLANAIRPGTAMNDMLTTTAEIAGIVLRVFNGIAYVVRMMSEAFGSFTGKLVGTVLVSAALVGITMQLVKVYIVLRTITAALLVLETGRAALSTRTAGQIAISIGAIAGAIDIVRRLTRDLGFASDEWDTLTTKMNASDLSLAGGRMNLGSAVRGSQEAVATVFGVKIEAPLDRMVKGQDKQNGLLEDIRDILRNAGVPENDIAGVAVAGGF